MKPIGPFTTEAEARAAAHEIVPPEGSWSILGPGQNMEILTLACASAGVVLGTYDEQIVEWLAGFSDASCAVFAGLITRAFEAGKRAPGAPAYLDEAAALLRQARDGNEARAEMAWDRAAGHVPVQRTLREVNDRRMEIAAAFTRLAAIRAGLPRRSASLNHWRAAPTRKGRPMADSTDASVRIYDFTGTRTGWERCDDGISQRFRFNITEDVLIWFRPGDDQPRPAAVAALRTLAAKASELADAIEGAGSEQREGESAAGP